jgi:hypothetical protein
MEQDFVLGAVTLSRKIPSILVVSVNPPSFCPLAFISTVPTGWIIVKFDIRNFYENLSRNPNLVKI